MQLNYLCQGGCLLHPTGRADDLPEEGLGALPQVQRGHRLLDGRHHHRQHPRHRLWGAGQ